MKACTLYGPTSPYCVEFLRGWADHWMPYDFFQVARMVLNPQQLLQWQMWVNDEARQMMIDQQSRDNPANLTYDILTGTGTVANVMAQLANVTLEMLHFIKETACRAWAKVDSANSDGSFVKIIQGHEKEYSQFIGKLKDAIEKYIKDVTLQNIILKQLAFENANEECQSILRPIQETSSLMEYLKAYKDIRSNSHRTKFINNDYFEEKKIYRKELPDINSMIKKNETICKNDLENYSMLPLILPNINSIQKEKNIKKYIKKVLITNKLKKIKNS
jgi:transcriptional regulator CtsR